MREEEISPDPDLTKDYIRLDASGRRPPRDMREEETSPNPDRNILTKDYVM